MKRHLNIRTMVQEILKLVEVWPSYRGLNLNNTVHVCTPLSYTTYLEDLPKMRSVHVHSTVLRPPTHVFLWRDKQRKQAAAGTNITQRDLNLLETEKYTITRL